MATHEQIYQQIYELLAPYNKSGVQLIETTNITVELELSSLDVMDFVALIEDCFDITIPLNVLPDLETVADVARLVVERVGG